MELEADEAVTLGDAERLRQLIDNLLANVRAHTPPGAPVHIDLTRTDSAAVVTVTDTGPGLDPDQLEHVFERFYRADASRARASGGVGLGLSIVAAVAEAHGGSVAASSPENEGARFTITLPLAPDGGSGAQAATASAVDSSYFPG